MTHIVIATFAGKPDIQDDDRPAVAALEARGARVSAAVWNGDPTVFDDADAVIVRSIWDYWDHMPALHAWFERLSARRYVFNPPRLMAWNADKHYLLALETAGARLPPCRFCAATPAAIADAMGALGVDEAVAKPTVSGGGLGVNIVRAGDPASLARAAAAINSVAIVQKLLPAIRDPGEMSLIFFDGAFSHAVFKRAAADPILCQPDHGGAISAVTPPPAFIDGARRILDTITALGHGAPFYARVDVIPAGDHENGDTGRVDAGLYLMEVELIEPTLFFGHAPGAADRFADGLMGRLNR